MMRALARSAVAFLCLALLPAAAYAQASITGIVRDTSGAVLPGVTVEASSPVLIEKARSATSDSTGRFTIADLRPGTYRVSFALTGFKTVIRDGLELQGTSVVTANAEMAIGTLEETITVSGATPVVDVQSTTRQVSINQEMMAAVPSSRTPFALGVLIPGVQQSFGSRDVGGAVVAEVAALAANGGRTGDQRMMVNGVALSSGIAGGWGGGAVPNASGTAEYAIDVSGVDAQAATGGVRVNFIPRDGGNRFSGTVAASYARDSFAADNYTDSDVQQRGLAAPNKIKSNGEFNPGAGGPIVRDKLWFFASGKYVYADNFVAGQFFNANANQPNVFQYARDLSRQAILHQDQQIAALRVTYQANQKNKIGFVFDQEAYCGCPFGTTATITPDGSQDRRFPTQRFVTADWTSPVTSRFLLEASGIHRVERWGNMHLQTGKGDNLDAILPGTVSVTDNPNPVTGGSLTYRSAAQYNNSWNWNIHYRFAASYVTGAHNFKVGFNNAFLHHENTTYTDPSAPYSYNFVGGNPSSLTYRITPRTVKVDVNYDLGIFAQDRYTVGRWTLQGGVRFDAFKNSYPPQSIAPTALAPNLNVQFDKIDNLSWKDVTPKMGLTYDLMGDGRTALKFTLNKYLEGMGTTGIGPANVSENPNPINRLVGTTALSSRPWNDAFFGAGDPRTGNFRPDCDLLNYQTNGECGTLTSAATFGTIGGGTNYDPDLLRGWGKRTFNWEMTAGMQHELIPRVALTVQYARRWYGNFRVTDDQAVTAADYERFTINVPSDSRLPNSGGAVTGFDLTTAANARATQYLVTLADNYGKQIEHFDGVNVGIQARLQNGLLLQGGVGPGRQVTDDCEVIDDLPEMLHTDATGNPSRITTNTARPLERCRQNNGWRTGVSGLASYVFPKIDVQVSGTYQNQPGVQINANAATCSGVQTATCTALTTNLGRAFSGGASRFFNLIPAGEVFAERLNQLDLRVAKIFRFNNTKTAINFDFYNVTNSNSVLTENNTFGTPWRTPQSILLPRLFKLSAQFDF